MWGDSQIHPILSRYASEVGFLLMHFVSEVSSPLAARCSVMGVDLVMGVKQKNAQTRLEFESVRCRYSLPTDT